MQDDDPKNGRAVAISIANHHLPECGPFPDWALSPPSDSYFGYFENEHGEQWVLSASAEKVRLAGGDCGWEQTFELTRPDWSAIAQKQYPAWPELIMDLHERAWVFFCLETAARRFQFAKRSEA